MFVVFHDKETVLKKICVFVGIKWKFQESDHLIFFIFIIFLEKGLDALI